VDPRQAAITTGQSYNLATQLVSSAPDFELSEGTLGDVVVLAGQIYDVLIEAQDAAAAAASVGNQFPGTQQVDPGFAPVQDNATVAGNNVVQFPNQQQVPVHPATQPAQPAPIPGATKSKKDLAWEAYFANPGDYYDNRGNKRNPAGPDFKHKQTGEGLWLGGQFPAPAWVLQRLGG
jgi:hypothetical protein